MMGYMTEDLVVLVLALGVQFVCIIALTVWVDRMHRQLDDAKHELRLARPQLERAIWLLEERERDMQDVERIVESAEASEGPRHDQGLLLRDYLKGLKA